MKATVAAVSMVLAVACGSAGTSISGDSRNVGGVTVTFKAEPSRVTTGMSVRLTLKLVNNAGRSETLTFPSAKKYDFWVTEEGEEVWRWSDDRTFIQVVTEDEIEPQSGQTYSESWRPDRRGTYVVHGALTAGGFDSEYTGTVEVTE